MVYFINSLLESNTLLKSNTWFVGYISVFVWFCFQKQGVFCIATTILYTPTLWSTFIWF